MGGAVTKTPSRKIGTKQGVYILQKCFTKVRENMHIVFSNINKFCFLMKVVRPMLWIYSHIGGGVEGRGFSLQDIKISITQLHTNSKVFAHVVMFLILTICIQKKHLRNSNSMTVNILPFEDENSLPLVIHLSIECWLPYLMSPEWRRS